MTEMRNSECAKENHDLEVKKLDAGWKGEDCLWINVWIPVGSPNSCKSDSNLITTGRLTDEGAMGANNNKGSFQQRKQGHQITFPVDFQYLFLHFLILYPWSNDVSANI